MLLDANFVKATECPRTSINIIWVVKLNSPEFQSPFSHPVIMFSIGSVLNVKANRIMNKVKNIAIVAVAASFMFGSVGFHYANNYTAMDEGTSVETSYGVTYDLNDNTSVGWDSALGMMMYFDAQAGVTLRLGWTAEVGPAVVGGNVDDGFVAETSVGLGFTWWAGGTGLKTSISTNYDYVMAPGATSATATQSQNSANLSVTVGFGF